MLIGACDPMVGLFTFLFPFSPTQYSTVLRFGGGGDRTIETENSKYQASILAPVGRSAAGHPARVEGGPPKEEFLERGGHGCQNGGSFPAAELLDLSAFPERSNGKNTIMITLFFLSAS